MPKVIHVFHHLLIYLAVVNVTKVERYWDCGQSASEAVMNLRKCHPEFEHFEVVEH